MAGRASVRGDAGPGQSHVDVFPHRSFVRQAGFYVFAGIVSAVVAAVVLRDMDAEQDDGQPHFGPPAPAPQYVEYMSQCLEHGECRQQEQTGTNGECCPDINGLFSACCDAIESSVSIEPFFGMCYAAEPTTWMDNTLTGVEGARVKVRSGPNSDDYWSPWSRPFWGQEGRDDLGRMAELGIKVIRLYGNDPREDHSEFLNRAHDLGLSVVIGMSDYIYTQAERDRGVSCARNTEVDGGFRPEDFDCSQAAKLQYTEMLGKGLTVVGYNRTRIYHPAVKAILVINEPELKACQMESREIEGVTVEQCFTNGETRHRALYTKAIISALDGMRSAEKEMDLVRDEDGMMPPFTVSWTFGRCTECMSHRRGNELPAPACNCHDGTCEDHMYGRTCEVGSFPGLPYMYDFAVGMLRPELLNYHGGANDLKELLQTRFMLAFNSQNRMDEICEQLLHPLKVSPLRHIPLWQGEFKAHKVSTDVDEQDRDTVKLFKDDLTAMRDYINAGDSATCTDKNGNVLEGKQVHGFGIFEFQVPYYKDIFPEAQQCWWFDGASRRPAQTGDWQFGIYSFGSRVNGTLSEAYWEQTGSVPFPVYCLRDRRNDKGSSWAEAIAEVLGGRHRDYDQCPPEEQEGVLSGGVWCDN